MTKEKLKILEDVVILYKDGKRENFNAIYINNKFIYHGEILVDGRFIEVGGIPKDGIEKIILFDKEGMAHSIKI